MEATFSILESAQIAFCDAVENGETAAGYYESEFENRFPLKPDHQLRMTCWVQDMPHENGVLHFRRPAVETLPAKALSKLQCVCGESHTGGVLGIDDRNVSWKLAAYYALCLKEKMGL